MFVQKRIFIIALIFSVSLPGCSNPSSSGENGDPSEWLIQQDEVVDGGVGKDGIPSIDDPVFAPVEEISYVDDHRLVVGVKMGNTVKAYPHQVLDWHEIVNDQIGDTYFTLTYCPLTGTGIAFDRELQGEITEFGVSGLLYRNNLIAYDRLTDTRWSQMQFLAVNGPLRSQYIETHKVMETTWGTWKKMYPGSEILTTQTGFARAYGGYAYGQEYLTDHNDFIFPVKNEDDRLPNKTRVHASILENPTGESTMIRVYPVRDMSDSIRVINEEYEDNLLVAVGSAEQDFTSSFYRTVDNGQTTLNFESVQDQLPIVMKDQEGNYWDVFGEAVEGPRQGERLAPVRSYNGYWFAVADFFPESCIYPNTNCKRQIDK